ncbi:Salutaridinol 7-O-acetyltransferase [Linum perenne]
MDFAVKVTSKSLIKPSSPTPLNLQQFKLSLLDKLYPSPLYPTVAPTLLRDSFTRTLSHFYPLAGRITHKDDAYISCNDQGAVYLEAEANQDMLHFLGTSPAPNKELLSFLAPPRPLISADIPLACVQYWNIKRSSHIQLTMHGHAYLEQEVIGIKSIKWIM